MRENDGERGERGNKYGSFKTRLEGPDRRQIHSRGTHPALKNFSREKEREI